MDIYVKPNSRCQGMPLTHFEELGPVWSGQPEIYFEGDNRELLPVAGYSSLFGGHIVDCHIVLSEIDGLQGYLIYGADFGLIIGKGSNSFGSPILWVEDANDLPEEVVKYCTPNG
jgi:hypothetical protein